MSDKISLNPRQLTLKDLARAKAGPLQGQNPLEYLDGSDGLEVAALIAWCVRSRDDPEFTWADAEALPLEEFDFGADDDQPPPTASPGEPGGSDANATPKPSRSRPSKPERPASSGTTSG